VESGGWKPSSIREGWERGVTRYHCQDEPDLQAGIGL